MIYPSAKITNREKLDIADSAEIGDFTLINTSGGVEMGEETVIHSFSAVVGSGGLTMRRGACVTYNCTILTSCPSINGRMSTCAPDEDIDSREGRVHLGRESFVGSGATIMPRVTLERGAVVGAGAYIAEGQTIPENTVVHADGTRRKRNRF